MTSASEQATPPRDNAGIRVYPPAIYLAALAAGFALQYVWPIPLVPSRLGLAARIAGASLLVAGFALALWAIGIFQAAKTSPHPMRSTTALAFGGPYRFTRNPMYLSLAVMSVGASLVGNALWPLLFLPLALAVIRRAVIDKEERYLEGKFGDEYLAFKARVRRWL
jgi:protein-S-isoprenylcysteine O-methyltransferase Ste14